MKTCKQCNIEYDDSKKFCKQCGDALLDDHKLAPQAAARKNVLEDKLKADPLNTALLLEYATFLSENGVYKAAVEVLLKLLAINENDPTATRMLFRAYIALENYKAATETGELLLKVQADDVELLTGMAKVLYHSGSYDKAIAYSDKALAVNASATDALYYKALANLKNKELTNALPLFEELRQTGNDSDMTVLYSGVHHSLAGNHETAVKLLTRVLSKEETTVDDQDVDRGLLYLCRSLVHTNASMSELDQWYSMIGFKDFRNHITALDEQNLADTVYGIVEKTVSGWEKIDPEVLGMFTSKFMVKPQVCFTGTGNDKLAAAWIVLAGKLVDAGMQGGAKDALERASGLLAANSEYRDKYDEVSKRLKNMIKRRNQKAILILAIIAAAIAIIVVGINIKNRVVENRAWQAAVEENTPGAFETYVRAYPEGRFTDEALVRQEDLIWNTARQENTFYFYDRYLKRYSNGKYVSEALNLQEEAAWVEASAKGTLDSYQKFIDRLPNGRRVEMARNELILVDERDEKQYKVVKIGNQWWMAENLNYVTASGSWCYANNLANCDIYGRLYNWRTALTVCPPGWHLPSNQEWNTLVNFLGGSDVAGGKLKEAGARHWRSPNVAATNSIWFSALPGGYRNSHGSFLNIGNYGYWWSSTERRSYSRPYAYRWYMRYRDGTAHRGSPSKADGFSVRCVRDN